MYNKVELCGVNTAELPILSEQEKRDLLTRARAGDKKARQSMIEGNLRLVLSVVQRFSQRGENMDDLFQVGCIGLIKAIDNFDPAQQVRFSTYGVPMIIGEIRRFLRDNNALRVSRSLRDTAYRAMQSREELEKQLGREPTVDEIAQKTGLSRREVFSPKGRTVLYGWDLAGWRENRRNSCYDFRGTKHLGTELRWAVCHRRSGENLSGTHAGNDPLGEEKQLRQYHIC